MQKRPLPMRHSELPSGFQCTLRTSKSPSHMDVCGRVWAWSVYMLHVRVFR